MKKLAIGCLVAAGVLLVVLVIGGYFVYRTASPYIASFTQLAEIPEIEKAVTNTASFTAPESGELSEDTVKRFVAVQTAVQEKLGPKFDRLRQKFEQIDKMKSEQRREASAAEVLAALSDLAGLLVQAKRAQVEALNSARFSLKEYKWVRERVYNAVGVPLREMDLRRIAEQARAGGTIVREVPTTGEVPERNKALVAPYADKLREWTALAFFGL